MQESRLRVQVAANRFNIEEISPYSGKTSQYQARFLINIENGAKNAKETT
jgi:hypothetical protein